MAPDVIAEVQQLVDLAELTAIETVALSAERLDDAVDDEHAEVLPDYKLGIKLRDDMAGFRAQLATEISLPIGMIRCVVYAQYDLTDGRIGPESTEAMSDFINGVALMHLLPFVRQSISDITMRVFNSPLLMPIMKRGDLGFELEYNPPAE